ncbi:MAG: FAD-dependent oxidoreductase [Ruminococcaceae bacterium]|nr:FAD-dependent oxidoreductase [Oscillospiraceae bacterium]
MIREALETQIKDNYDVAVCGGGVAGIAAAIAAARLGKRTLLIERQFMLGGLATAGLVTIYLPLCDGYGKQVSFGLAEELLRLSIKHGAEDRYPENWLDGVGTKTERDKRFQVQFNAQIFAILAEQELKKSGADILYGTSVCAVHKEGNKIDALIIENKSGRSAVGVKSVVDASGDCDVAYMAGAPTDLYKQGNVLAAWYYYANKGEGYNLKSLGAVDIPEEELKMSGGKQRPALVNRHFSGLDGKEISEMTELSHKVLLDDFLAKRGGDDSMWLSTIATIPQLRMTRKIVGEYELKTSEMHTEFKTSIGMVSNWKKRGPVYEVPFETLYSASVKNLAVAGRCTSVDQTLWDVMRVIPCCAVTGQAAGTAAALSDDFTALDIKYLQDTLRKNGVVLHEKDI